MSDSPGFTAFTRLEALLVGFSRQAADGISRCLSEEFGTMAAFELQPALSGAMESIKEGTQNAVLFHLDEPVNGGYEGVSRLAACASGTPIIVVGSSQKREVALEVLARGAQDYLHKDCLDAPTLAVSLSYSIQRKKAEQDRVCKARRSKSVLQSPCENQASIVHELKGPLYSINTFAELLANEAKGNLPPEQQEWVSHIRTSGTELLQLMEDLVDSTAVSAGKLSVLFTKTAIAPLLERLQAVFEPRASEKGLSLNLQVSDDLPTYVFTDPRRLNQILRNLLSNAVKSTESGSLTVTARRALAGETPRLSGPFGGGGSIAISVIDTGPGIPSKAAAEIFKPFWQGATGHSTGNGSGLGLAITKQLATFLGGDVQLVSEEGRGSTFTVWLPIRKKTKEKKKKEKTAKRGRLKWASAP